MARRSRSRVRLRVHGVEALLTAIPRYGKDVVQAVVNDAEAIGLVTVEQMRLDAAYDATADRYPHLRDRISASVTYRTSGFRLVLRAASRIAHLIEFGTQHHVAYPFFIPNVLRARNALRQAVARAVTTRAPRDLHIRVSARAGYDTLPMVDLD